MPLDEKLLQKYIRLFTEDQQRYQETIRFGNQNEATRSYFQGRADETARVAVALRDVLQTAGIREVD